MKRVTIHDVARKAGVSVTTVSRVLNDRGYISNEMKEKVLNTIEELNYIPNEMARSFFSNQSKFIALIVPTTENPFFGELTFHVEKALAKFGYHLFICNSLNDSENEEKYLRLLNEKRVDGIIVGSHNVDISEYKNYEDQIVSIERKLTKNIPMVQSDDYNGGRLATQELITQGCTNILCVTGDKNVETPANDRSIGYVDEIEKNNYRKNFIEIPFQIDLDEKLKIIKETFQGDFKYDGVFAGDDVNAKLFLNVAKEMGYDVPKDVKVIGFDGTQSIRYLVPELSTVVQPIENLAYEAVTTLLDLLKGKKVKNEVILPVELYLSETTQGSKK
ncbi:transcriptional regulator, LacI family [Alkalibacterium subtropicum]|uniref:Transcriptional regulator, LacI family n=1 Tax=Alkalibacterium subtropicum TaxID=753702 RepID=A0A1I1KQT4_9LACT|nr:LacI family DNA-binding transcriptional regulator [Alkalibacterium subtropicum]SFC63071.1 transcriptional regulator, LacI family [Alkalibacterium subtropicum]